MHEKYSLRTFAERVAPELLAQRKDLLAALAGASVPAQLLPAIDSRKQSFAKAWLASEVAAFNDNSHVVHREFPADFPSAKPDPLDDDAWPSFEVRAAAVRQFRRAEFEQRANARIASDLAEQLTRQALEQELRELDSAVEKTVLAAMSDMKWNVKATHNGVDRRDLEPVEIGNARLDLHREILVVGRVEWSLVQIEARSSSDIRLMGTDASIDQPAPSPTRKQKDEEILACIVAMKNAQPKGQRGRDAVEPLVMKKLQLRQKVVRDVWIRRAEISKVP